MIVVNKHWASAFIRQSIIVESMPL